MDDALTDREVGPGVRAGHDSVAWMKTLASARRPRWIADLDTVAYRNHAALGHLGRGGTDSEKTHQAE